MLKEHSPADEFLRRNPATLRETLGLPKLKPWWRRAIAAFRSTLFT